MDPGERRYTRPPARERFRYWFDDTLSSGTRAMMLSLTLATVVLIVVVSVAAALAGVEADGSPLSFGEALWSSLMRTLDPGTMGDDVGWPLRVASLTVTVGGVLIVSSLIGLLANGISERAAELRRGHSPVVESDHTLVLGWSPKVFPLVSQLAIAGEGDGKTTIAVLAPLDKGEMERQIEARVADRRDTKIVCRTGTPFEPIHIAIARPEAAKAIVVLNTGHEDGDAEVVKTTLALLRTTDLRPDVPVIAEVSGAFSAAALRDGTAGRVTVVRSATVIARLAAQVCRQPGLSGVYQELLDFEGHEIYTCDVPALHDKTFAEAVLAFDNAAPIGVKSADGSVLLNPGAGHRIVPGDELIAIAADEDEIVFTGVRKLPAAAGDGARPNEPVERILMIGWNHMGPEIVHELDAYVSPGSTLAIRIDREVLRADDVDVPHTAALRVSLSDDRMGPDELRSLIAADPPDHVIVLCYKERLTEAQADARVLLTLLHLRAAIDALGHPTNIVAELLDERDVGLTPSRENDEFIVSERLTALLMAQLAESTDRGPVFDELLEQEGSEIYLKPPELYGPHVETMTFAEIVASATERGEVAIGYQACAGASPRSVVLNPPKEKTLDLSPDDRVIVIAETGA